MARASFGGGGDFSGVFGSLYSANKAAAQAKQDADDQDAQDRWEHGIMTDADWLAYIQNRINAETDPRRKERWITAQREYVPLIADKQAEFEYSNGGSINQLVAHYQQRLAGLVPGSNEYREIALKLNDAQDARSAENLQAASDAMIDQINAGKKTYNDLLKLLTDASSHATANSDFKKSVDKQIKDVRETIRTNKLEGSFEKLQYDYDRGTLSASSYARKLRSMAVQFKDSDPKRYYQILEAAQALTGGGRSGGGGGGGGGGRSGGGSGGSGSPSTKSINKSIDSLQATRNNLLAAVGAYEDGATSFVDASGKRVALTPAYIKSVDSQLVSTFDQLAHAYVLKKDKSAAANQKKAKATYISSAVVKHNTMAADESSRHLLEASAAQVQHALDNPDPVRARADLADVASQWENYSRNLTSSVLPAVAHDAPSQYAAQARTPKGDMDKVDPDFVTRSATLAAAFRTLTTPGVDDASAAAAMDTIGRLQGAGGGQYQGGQQDSALTSLLRGALEVGARVQGLETGDLERVATASGFEWVKKVEVSTSVPDPNNPSNMVLVKTKVPTGQTLSGKNLDVDGKSSKYVTVLVDINGKPTPVKAIAEKVPASGFDALKVGKDITLPDGTKLYAGTSLTEAQIQKLKKSASLQEWMQSGKVVKGAAFESWQVTVPGHTDQYGKFQGSETWTQDAGTGMWYKGALPVRGVQRDADGYVIVGDDGKPAIDYKAYASAIGVPAPYSGTDAKGAQDLLNSGVIDVSGILGRDLNGNLTGDTQDMLSSAYWHADYRPHFTSDESWWNKDDRDQRSADLVDRDRQLALKAGIADNRPYQGPTGQAGIDMAKAFKDAADKLGISLLGSQKAQEPVTHGATEFDLGPTGAKASGPAIHAEVNLALPKPAAPTIKLPKPSKKPYEGPKGKQGVAKQKAYTDAAKKKAAAAAAAAAAKKKQDASHYALTGHAAGHGSLE